MYLKGKTALITGAARRIGREIALELAARQAAVVIHYDRSRKEAARLQKDIEAAGGTAGIIQEHFLSSGRTSIAACRRFALRVQKLAGAIDILVNNASIFYPTPLRTIRDKDWDDFMGVNLQAPFFLAREFGLQMARRKWGKIVNMVDWTGLRPHPDYLPYAISKAGLIAAGTGLARALAPHVQVLNLAPGPILPAERVSKGRQKQVLRQTLAKRYGSPADIARTVRFFVEDTNYITGALLPVDGGALIA